MTLKLAFGAAAAILLAVGPAYADDPAAVAKARHDHYEEIGKAAKAIREALKQPAPDLAVIQAGAKTLDTLAPQVPGWFPPGTGRDVVPKSAALPAIWEKPDEFKKDAAAFATAAHTFASAAQGGQIDAVKAAFPAVGDACRTCHQTFKAKDN